MRRRMLPIIIVWLIALPLAGCHRRIDKPVVTLTPLVGTTETAFRAADGWTIHADYAEVVGATRAVILLHQRNGAAADWQPVIAKLTEAGVASLALDQRGAGRSTGAANGSNAPWNTEPDITAAVAWLTSKGFASKEIELAGASYGANNALIYAAAHPEVPAVALVSPGTNYHGLRICPAAAAYRGRLLTVWAQNDAITEDGPATIARAANGRGAQKMFPGDAHGAYLFNAHPDSVDAVVRFLIAK